MKPTENEYVFIAKIPEVQGPFPYLRRKITHRVDAKEASLDSVIEAFEDFLRGAGFNFDGSLSIVHENFENEET